MTDLGRLKVSLTKHNAHKVARLLKSYDASEVFARLDEVHADVPQTRKNLSTLAGDVLPPVWAKVQTLGPDAIDALLLIAIIFSHNDLIQAMKEALDRQVFSGRIDRDGKLRGKAYTNVVRIIDQLGYASKVEKRAVTFNLTGMFEVPGLGPLVSELLQLKLEQAKWTGENDFFDEVADLGFHDVFGVTANELKAWLASGVQPAAARPFFSAKDEAFFRAEAEGTGHKNFRFRQGHERRDVEPINIAASPKSLANRMHNAIQNELYDYLTERLGAASVGTELDTGYGTVIDLVTRYQGTMTFYEIKTGSSVRASIRQALPQLLEYAFWPEARRADELVIVSHLAITLEAEKYLRFLRDKFNLPISYRQFDLAKKVLC